jgi:hypothetical protein
MAIAGAWRKPQAVTSTPQQTATFTKIPEAVGVKRKVPHITLPHIPEPILLLLTAMEGRKRAAGHLLLVAAEEAAGNHGRKVRVVLQAVAVAVDGAGAGDAGDASAPLI